jgi:hypothetical protein
MQSRPQWVQIEEGQTIQWSNEKWQKDKQPYTKHYTENNEPHYKPGENSNAPEERVGSLCSPCGTSRTTPVTNPTFRHEWGIRSVSISIFLVFLYVQTYNVLPVMYNFLIENKVLYECMYIYEIETKTFKQCFKGKKKVLCLYSNSTLKTLFVWSKSSINWISN